MLLIPCPWCGPRDESEFRCGGEADRPRPARPQETDDLSWTDYLYLRANPKGHHHELWFHAYGCRQWLLVVRHTVTHEIVDVRRLDEGSSPPGENRTP